MVLDKLVAIFLLILYSARNVNGATFFFRLTFSRATLTIPLQQTNLIILIKAHSPVLNNLPILLPESRIIFSLELSPSFFFTSNNYNFIPPFPIANLSISQTQYSLIYLFITLTKFLT